jgi:hypothetical protein
MIGLFFFNWRFLFVVLMLAALGASVVLKSMGFQSAGVSALPTVSQAAAVQKHVERTAQIWTATKTLTAQQNAENHFRKHNRDFKFKSVDQYVAVATKFLRTPPMGAQTKKQSDGDTVVFLPRTGEFAVMRADGTPRTYFILNPDIHGYPTNQAYFDAQ